MARGSYNNEVVGRGRGGGGGRHGGGRHRGRSRGGRGWGGWGWGGGYGYGGWPSYGWGWPYDSTLVTVPSASAWPGQAAYPAVTPRLYRGGSHRQVHYLMGADPSRAVHPVAVAPTPAYSAYPGHPAYPVHPGVPVHAAPPSRAHPPASHLRHHDYGFADGWGWWPIRFPYWDPSWRAYWQSLYDYFGGDANSDYAEYARDATVRQVAAQRGRL